MPYLLVKVMDQRTLTISKTIRLLQEADIKVLKKRLCQIQTPKSKKSSFP